MKKRDNPTQIPIETTSGHREADHDPPAELPAKIDPLADFRASLQELKAMAAELIELTGKRKALGDELSGLVTETKKVADVIVSEPQGRELESELESLARRQDSLRPQLEALERRFYARAETLQKQLHSDYDGWARLRQAIVEQVAQEEGQRFADMLSSTKRGDEHLIKLCSELGQATDAYLETFALKLPGRSFAWQRIIAEVPADSWQPGVKRDDVVGQLLEVAGQFNALASQLLDRSTVLKAIPPFRVPETPQETHFEYNEALDSRPLSAKLLEASGKRLEHLTEMDRKILRDSEEANNSYLKQARLWVGVPVTEGAEP